VETTAEPDPGRWVHVLMDLEVVTYSASPLLPRVWTLRDNLTPHDAVYVALAEVLDCLLVTGDTRIAGAPGVVCGVEIV
jgi:predicted nucleic acid-binding protein